MSSSKKFVAPDGQTFTTRKEMKKYTFETFYSFKNQKSTILKKESGEISGQPFNLTKLEECEITLTDHTDQVQIDDCSGCKIFIGACSTSVFVRNCNNCVLFLSTKQLRLRDCVNCIIYLHCRTEPVIETSTQIQFAPFAGGYQDHGDHLQKANLKPDENLWWGVFDFNDPHKTRTNWRYLQDSEKLQPWFPRGPCKQIVKKTQPGSSILPSQLDSNGGISSFSFSTTQEQATKLTQQPAILPPQVSINTMVQPCTLENMKQIKQETPPPPPAAGVFLNAPPAPNAMVLG